MLRLLNVVVVALILVLGLTALAKADPQALPTTQPLSLTPSYLATDSAAPAAALGSAIHGYMETQLKTAHITPRGLVVADNGVEVQPAAGLTFDLLDGKGVLDKASATFGVWNSVNNSLHIPSAGPWFEIDYFARLNLQFEKRINFSLQYVAFDSPGHQFQTDNNLEFTLNYDDTNYLLRNFGVHPYTRLFYNMSGGSTTALGRNGDTYDVELGFVPTYVWKAVADYPVTLSLPTYVTVGPKDFWGGDSNVGVFTTALAGTVPLHCIPEKFGRWHMDASVAYFNLLNGRLVDAAAALGNRRDRNWVVGELGIGMDF